MKKKSDADKKRLDAIYRAFEGYIKSQDFFDIVYSEKYGYLRVSLEEELQELDTPDEMLARLCYDLICEVVYSPDNPHKEHEDYILTEYEKTESRRRLTEILAKLDSEEKTSYVDKIEDYFEDYEKSGISPYDDEYDDEDDEDDEGDEDEDDEDDE